MKSKNACLLFIESCSIHIFMFMYYYHKQHFFILLQKWDYSFNLYMSKLISHFTDKQPNVKITMMYSELQVYNLIQQADLQNYDGSLSKKQFA